MKKPSSFFVRLGLPAGTSQESREALAEILTRVASRFSFQGLEDWSVDLPVHVKVLGAEREFHDLRRRGPMNAEMRVYFARRDDGVVFAKLVGGAIAGLKVHAVRPLVAQDWMKAWRKHYRTQRVRAGGRSLQIVPAWKKAGSGLAVKIYPGQAFGTGTHPTTRLCLAAFLESLQEIPASLRLLDFGAGTGVLALGALAALATEGRPCRAVLVESDPVALEQCGKNVRLNRRIAKGASVRLARKMPARAQYDFIFANVLAPVLLAEREALAGALAPGGMLVLSGILAKEAKAFARKFARGLGPRGLKLVGEKREGDWAALVYRRG